MTTMRLQNLAYLLVLTLTFFSCKNNGKVIEQLNDSDKKYLETELKKMLGKDQKYRSIISLGTLNDSLLAIDEKLRGEEAIQEYITFTKSIEKTLTDKQTDSLWNLQHQADYDNYLKLKAIIKKYGYPSKSRISDDVDVFPILLHPPVEIEPEQYLNEMTALLKPEVIAKRMSGKFYAMFYDNIKEKVLNEPQLYGTNRAFNPETMTFGAPIIVDLEKTNKARKQIGLPELKEGEYKLAQ